MSVTARPPHMLLSQHAAPLLDPLAYWLVFETDGRFSCASKHCVEIDCINNYLLKRVESLHL